MVAKYSGARMGIHGGAPLVDRPLRLKEINRILMSRSLRVQPQANMGSGLVE